MLLRLMVWQDWYLWPASMEEEKDYDITTEEYSDFEKWKLLLSLDWETLVKTTNPNYDSSYVQSQLERMMQINQELIKLWSWCELPSYIKLDTARNAKITELQAEFTEIKTDLDSNYEETLVDTLINSLFD